MTPLSLEIQPLLSQLLTEVFLGQGRVLSLMEFLRPLTRGCNIKIAST